MVCTVTAGGVTPAPAALVSRPQRGGITRHGLLHRRHPASEIIATGWRMAGIVTRQASPGGVTIGGMTPTRRG